MNEQPGTRMGRAALVVSAGVLVSRLLGLVRDVVLAGLVGNTSAGDVYEAAFLLPDYLFYLMAGGYLSITFIPILSGYLAVGDRRGGWEALTAVARPVGTVMVVLTVAAMVAARPLVEAAFRGLPDLAGAGGARLSASQLDEVASLTRIVLPAQVFFVLGSLFMAVQYAHHRFLIPTLAPVVYNLGIIAGGLLGVGGRPAAGFVWGALAGAFVGNFALQVVGARRCGWRWERGVPLGHPALGQYLAMAVPLMAGQSVVVLDEQLTRVFGQLGEEGAIFALGRARRLNMLPVGMIAQAAGVAAYPFLARLAAEGRPAELSETVARAVRY
ncbi:MAG: lipid II flippase MurJ, partial [Acidimicrobiia bacterium]